MTLHAITVLGHDRPGIIAETTHRLAGLGLNLEDSSMTLLRGHFAMTLICSGGAGEADIAASLAPLSADGQLTVTVREVPVEEGTDRGGSSWVLTVHGGDRPGIVSAIAQEIARVGGNVTDLTTRLGRDLYLLVAEVDLPVDVDPASVESSLVAVAERLGVGVSCVTSSALLPRSCRRRGRTSIRPRPRRSSLLLTWSPRCGSRRAASGWLLRRWGRAHASSASTSPTTVVRGELPGTGERVELEVTAFEARAVQHEIDHCDGLLFLDRAAGAHAIYARTTYL